jgi:hypothetical protein
MSQKRSYQKQLQEQTITTLKRKNGNKRKRAKRIKTEKREVEGQLRKRRVREDDDG